VGGAARRRRRAVSDQLAYVLERSRFYRDKLAAAALGSARDAGGLAELARLPLTDKQELRATCTPEDPIGAHPTEAAADVRGYVASMKSQQA
jgi:phenylacetate-CoA ligase